MTLLDILKSMNRNLVLSVVVLLLTKGGDVVAR